MSRRSFPTQKFLFATCLSSFSLFATLQGENLAPDKILQVKRISEYWKDKDYKRAKKYIIEFLQASPQSPVHDQLYAMLGDLYFLENDYIHAIDAYSQVKEASLQLKVCKNLLQSYFSEKNYRSIIEYVKGKPEVLALQEIRMVYAETLLQALLSSNDQRNPQKIELVKQQYQALVGSDYKNRALRVLAFLHQSAEEYPQAASMYQSLIALQPDEEESLMMEIACLQIHYDMPAAIQTFETIYEKNGKFAAKAAYNQMILLFDMGDMDKFLEKKDHFSSKLSEDQIGLLHFLLGRGYYAKNDYSQAVEEFQGYFNSSNRKKNHDTTAFLTVLDCAKETKNLELFEKTTQDFLNEFPNTSETENLLLIQTQLCIDVGQLSKAKDCIAKIQEQFPSSVQYEPLLIQYAVTLLQNSLWEEGHVALKNFISNFPSSKHKLFAQQQLVECSFQLLQNSKEENKEIFQRNLCADINELLKSDIAVEKKQIYLFYLAENLFSLKEYEQSKSKLFEYAEAYPSSSNFSQALFLIALCDLHTNNEEEFTSSAERAISSTKDPLQKEFLYLQLYNTYLSLKETNKAADALYACYEVNANAISLDNLCWLAEHYSQNAQKTLADQDIARATKILSVLMQSLSQENSYLETEALHYAQLLDAQQKFDEKLAVLQELEQLQKQDSSNWRQQNQTLLEIARTYQKLGNLDEAAHAYDKLNDSDSTYHSSIATLEKCQMILKMKNAENAFSDDDAQTSQILDNLKDLQIKKHLATEPIHLEAALSYAELRILLASQDFKDIEAIFFLNRILEDFQSDDYLKYHDQFPGQLEMYQAYMSYVELEIDLIKAEMAKKENQLEEMASLQAQARSKLDKLSEKNLPSYLKERIRKTQQQL